MFSGPIPDPNSWLDWWQDPDRVGLAQVVLGGLGLLISVVALIAAIVVAVRQFRMMTEQGKIIDKQLEMMEEETATSKRIEAITQKQAQIAEIQHQILEYRADLTARVYWIEDWESLEYRQFVIAVLNEGRRTAPNFYWQILIPYGLHQNVKVVALEGAETIAEKVTPDRLNNFFMYAGYITKPVYPGSRPIGVMRLHIKSDWFNQTGPGSRAEFLWALSAEEGRKPERDHYWVRIDPMGPIQQWNPNMF